MNRETEILDVAPVDMLNSMTKSFVKNIKQFYPGDVDHDGLDIDFHWVNESGKPAKLTGGITLLPTVS